MLTPTTAADASRGTIHHSMRPSAAGIAAPARRGAERAIRAGALTRFVTRRATRRPAPAQRLWEQLGALGQEHRDRSPVISREDERRSDAHESVEHERSGRVMGGAERDTVKGKRRLLAKCERDAAQGTGASASNDDDVDDNA